MIQKFVSDRDNMRKKLYAVIFFLLVVTYEIVLAKEVNKTKLHKTNNKQHSNIDKFSTERIKRSLDDEEDKPFWANRGKKKNTNENHSKNDNGLITKLQKRNEYFEKEPFWEARGRRGSVSVENNEYNKNPEYSADCKDCYGTINFKTDNKNSKDRRDETFAPFWGARGRRSSHEVDDPNDPFWGTRGRRQDNEPFWGTRGRRQDTPFWGARGRREDEPFWGNRGRRDDPEPFWGNRGRRQDSEPFWGTRGRRDDEPFWGNRGRRTETAPLWDSRGRRKEDLKESILNAINLVENDIEHLSRLRRSEPRSFLLNIGRDSKFKNIFDSPNRNRFLPQKAIRDINVDMKTEPGTVHDSRIFADEPHYIVVERSGRSSAEAEDPYFISRGKKYNFNYETIKAARDRRGAIEEIVKTVRNDPYYIARGKKDVDVFAGPMINSTTEDEFAKVKELICTAIDLVSARQSNGKFKREIDSDRNRRSALKKLAAQLQIDPYYVSRGKKSDTSPNTNSSNSLLFITEIAAKCN